MKCACRDPKCDKEIGIDTVSGMISIEMGHLRTTSSLGVYIDPNLAIALIKKLREYLQMAGDVEL